MLSSSSLQPPKSGKSRFSKALPAVPGLLNLNTENALPPLPLTPRKEVPVPPPRSAARRSPTKEIPFSPLSSVASPTSSAGTPTSVKSKMTIPRRPVGSAVNQKGPGLPVSPAPDRKLVTPVSPPVQQPLSTTNLVPPPRSTRAPVTTPASTTAATKSPMPYIPPPSPSASLSSLLSAYSRSSNGSPVVSSEGTVSSFRDSHQTTSPTQFEKSPDATAILTASSTPITPITFTPVPPPKESSSITSMTARQPASNLQSKPSLSPVPVETAPPPPPPAKNSTSTHQSSPAVSQRQLPPGSELSSPSPPRPQIWRRRSINKSKDLPPITIHSSHGSTASSTTPQVPPKADPETVSVLTQSTTETIKPLPQPTSAKPPSSVVGLPGRNVRPVQLKQAEPEVKSDMGNDASKLRRLSGTLHLPRSSGDSHSPTKPEPTKPLALGRPPTPEYQKEDVKTPILETFISPVSPASSPEPGKDAPPPVSKGPSSRVATPASKQLPKLDTVSITRKAVVPAPAPVPDLHSTRSVPDFRSATPSPPTVALPALPPAAPSFPVNRERRPSDAASTRGREFADTAKFPPRGSSAKPEARAKLPSSQFSSQSLPYAGSPDTDPRLVRSESGGFMYRGRDGTLYPEMKDPGTPDPKASYFPTNPQGRVPEGTILPAPPLRHSHYVCYQKHRNMGRRGNRQYPLTCQTCDKADVEDRFVCTFCQLRICSSCNDKFSSKGRDLKQLMEAIRNPEAPHVLSLSSGERPGSALGLQINF